MNNNTATASAEQQLLQRTVCERAFACLNDDADCHTLRFTNRDVEVVKCLGTAPCAKRRSYDGMQICTCAVQRRNHGL